jgi:hypothetical protein
MKSVSKLKEGVSSFPLIQQASIHCQGTKSARKSAAFQPAAPASALAGAAGWYSEIAHCHLEIRRPRRAAEVVVDLELVFPVKRPFVSRSQWEGKSVGDGEVVAYLDCGANGQVENIHTVSKIADVRVRFGNPRTTGSDDGQTGALCGRGQCPLVRRGHEKGIVGAPCERVPESLAENETKQESACSFDETAWQEVRKLNLDPGQPKKGISCFAPSGTKHDVRFFPTSRADRERLEATRSS